MKNLVLYSAEWCNPCKMLKKSLEALEKENVGFELEIVDIDKDPDRTAKARVRGVPTLHKLEGDKVVGASVGAKTKSELKSFIEG